MKNLLIFLLACQVSMNAWAQERNNDGAPIISGIERSIHSKILGEDRVYSVYVPDAYNDEIYAPQRYPVLYVLDGQAHFLEAAGVVNFMSAGRNANFQMPEMIVVAVTTLQNRTRDLTPVPAPRRNEGDDVQGGGGDAFLDFMETELIPTIDRDFRTTDFKVFVGHSFGALTNLYSMFRSPGLFDGYIAIDPGSYWGNEFLVSYGREHLPEDLSKKPKVFMSIAGTFDENGIVQRVMYQPNGRFRDFMRTDGADYFDFEFREFPHEDHGSVPLISLYYGLLHVFDGFKPTYAEKETAESLQSHFDEIAPALGFRYTLPEHIADRFAEGSLQGGNLAEAEDFFRYNVETYSASPHAYKRLAEFYENQGRTDEAKAVRKQLKAVLMTAK